MAFHYLLAVDAIGFLQDGRVHCVKIKPCFNSSPFSAHNFI